MLKTRAGHISKDWTGLP